jgi:hypothetical protein
MFCRLCIVPHAAVMAVIVVVVVIVGTLLSLWGLQATGIRHRVISLAWAHECHNLVLETLLVAWLQLEPEEIITVLRGGRVVNRKPDGRRPVSLESQAVAFWACDILAKLMRECVPLAPQLCRCHQPHNV